MVAFFVSDFSQPFSMREKVAEGRMRGKGQIITSAKYARSVYLQAFPHAPKVGAYKRRRKEATKTFKGNTLDLWF